MLLRALFALAVVAPLLAAQPRAGGALPPMGPRNPLAEPIAMDSAPAYVRRGPVTDATIQRIWDENYQGSEPPPFMPDWPGDGDFLLSGQ